MSCNAYSPRQYIAACIVALTCTVILSNTAFLRSNPSSLFSHSSEAWSLTARNNTRPDLGHEAAWSWRIPEWIANLKGGASSASTSEENLQAAEVLVVQNSAATASQSPSAVSPQQSSLATPQPSVNKWKANTPPSPAKEQPVFALADQEKEAAAAAGRPTPAATPAVAGRQARRLLFQDKHQAVRKQLPAAIASLRAPSVTGLAAAVTPEGQAAVKAWATGCEGGCSCAVGCDSDPGELNVVALLVGEDGGGWGGYTVPSSAADVVSGWQSESDAARKGGGVVPQSCLAALVCSESPKSQLSSLAKALREVSSDIRIGRSEVVAFPAYDSREKDKRKDQDGTKGAELSQVPNEIIQLSDMSLLSCTRCGHAEATHVAVVKRRQCAHRMVSSVAPVEALEYARAKNGGTIPKDAFERDMPRLYCTFANRIDGPLVKRALDFTDATDPSVWKSRPHAETLALAMSMCGSIVPGYRYFTPFASAASTLWAMSATPSRFSVSTREYAPPLPKLTPTHAQGGPEGDALTLRFGSNYWRFTPEQKHFDEKSMFGGCALKCKLSSSKEPLKDGTEAAVIHHVPRADMMSLFREYGAASRGADSSESSPALASVVLPSWAKTEPKTPQILLLQLESALNHGTDGLLSWPHALNAAYGPDRVRQLTLSHTDGLTPYVDHAQLGFMYIPGPLLDPNFAKMGAQSHVLDGQKMGDSVISDAVVFSIVQNCRDESGRRGTMSNLHKALTARGLSGGLHNYARCQQNIPDDGMKVTMPADAPNLFYWGTVPGRPVMRAFTPFAQARQCWMEAWKKEHRRWLGASVWKPCIHGETADGAALDACPTPAEQDLEKCKGDSKNVLPKAGDMVDVDIRLSDRMFLYEIKATDQILRGLYKFGMAMENSNCRQYVTEKPYVMLNGGAIPIVRSNRGVPAYPRHLPPASYVDTAWFEMGDKGSVHTNSMAAFIDITHRNPPVYWLMHEWRRHWPWTLRDVSMAGTPSERQTPPYLNGDPLRCLTVWRVDLEDARGRLGAEKLAAGVQAVGVVDLVASACASLGGSPEVHCELLVNVTRRLSEEVVLMRTVGQPDCGGDALTRAFTELGQPESFATTTGNVWCDICDDMHADRQWSEDEKRVLQWRQGSGGKPELVVGSPIRLGADDALHPSQCN